jgi:hypothetical protein
MLCNTVQTTRDIYHPNPRTTAMKANTLPITPPMRLGYVWYALNTDTDRSASYLDLHLEIDSEGRLRTKLYDKRDDSILQLSIFH